MDPRPLIEFCAKVFFCHFRLFHSKHFSARCKRHYFLYGIRIFALGMGNVGFYMNSHHAFSIWLNIQFWFYVVSQPFLWSTYSMHGLSGNSASRYFCAIDTTCDLFSSSPGFPSTYHPKTQFGYRIQVCTLASGLTIFVYQH